MGRSQLLRVYDRTVVSGANQGGMATYPTKTSRQHRMLSVVKFGHAVVATWIDEAVACRCRLRTSALPGRCQAKKGEDNGFAAEELDLMAQDMEAYGKDLRQNADQFASQAPESSGGLKQAVDKVCNHCSLRRRVSASQNMLHCLHHAHRGTRWHSGRYECLHELAAVLSAPPACTCLAGASCSACRF